jgi:hypothetical protein
MLSDPRSGSKVCEPLHLQIGKSGEDRGQIVAQRELQPPTAFQTERIAATFGAACGLSMWIQFFRPRATGRIEFSARLLFNSSSGYSRNRVSFLHVVSAYWQALLSTLEGNATDCAASILLRISSSNPEVGSQLLITG